MIIGTYSGGSASAYEYTTFQELLTQLPDNTANQIDAINVRNSVYTLWQRIEEVRVIASQSGSSASVTYTNLSPTPVTVGGISSGSTFSNATMKDMWDKLLYPYIAPGVSLSPNVSREFGASNSVNLSWSVTKNTNNINSIIITQPNGVQYTIAGAPFTTSQSGTKLAYATSNTNGSFTLAANDGTSTSTTSVSIGWYSAVYWGKTPTFALPSMTISGTQPAWADGAGVGSGKSLASSRAGSYNGINGSGQYLVFAWPASFGSPTFTINGLPNTAFTKIGNAVNHTNMNGYIAVYDVWISNTAQNSPITSFVIS